MLVARTLLLSLIQACGAATLQMDRCMILTVDEGQYLNSTCCINDPCRSQQPSSGSQLDALALRLASAEALIASLQTTLTSQQSTIDTLQGTADFCRSGSHQLAHAGYVYRQSNG